MVWGEDAWRVSFLFFFLSRDSILEAFFSSSFVIDRH